MATAARVPYVGPMEVRFRNRCYFTGAMVLGHEVLLEEFPMGIRYLVLRPQLQSVDVNPESRIFRSAWRGNAIVKGRRCDHRRHRSAPLPLFRAEA